MFTGLVQAAGAVRDIEGGHIQIFCPWPAGTIPLGASIACDGCCLTVTAIEPQADGSIFSVDVSLETLSKTTLGQWQAGRRINLERSLKAGDELGGHFVTGHVDGVAEIKAITEAGFSRVFEIALPQHLAGFIAPKGSAALDGVSLTVNDVSSNMFAVNLIPHTLAVTNWGDKMQGDRVNLEVDLIARYVARLIAVQAGHGNASC